MAAVTVAAAAIAPAAAVGKSEFAGSSVVAARGIPALSRRSSPLRVEASGGKKIQTKEPYGPGGGAKFRNGLDAAGGKAKGKGVYQFGKKYGANVDGYSPIYSPEEWSPSGDVYAPGQTGLALWAVTLGAILLGGALLVYNTSALVQ